MKWVRTTLLIIFVVLTAGWIFSHLDFEVSFNHANAVINSDSRLLKISVFPKPGESVSEKIKSEITRNKFVYYIFQVPVPLVLYNIRITNAGESLKIVKENEPEREYPLNFTCNIMNEQFQLGSEEYHILRMVDLASFLDEAQTSDAMCSVYGSGLQIKGPASVTGSVGMILEFRPNALTYIFLCGAVLLLIAATIGSAKTVRSFITWS